jgi:glycerol uptake facilitator-like aquaporin
MRFDLTRRLGAEALGTFFLVMAVVGIARCLLAFI